MILKRYGEVVRRLTKFCRQNNRASDFAAGFCVFRLIGDIYIMAIKIVGIIALYNPTAADFANVEKYIDGLDECLLLDDSGNNNLSECKDFIEKHPGRVHYMPNETNVGLTKSVNRGFEKAIADGADWVLVMNPDGVFENDAIGIYRDYIENHDCSNVAIIVPQYNFDRHPRKAGVGLKTVKYADMSGSLYNTKVLKKIGLYDPKTFFYGLDTEYCLRVKKNDYRMIECSAAVLHHQPAHTETLKIGNKVIFRYGKDVPVRYYYQFRSGYYIHYLYHDFKQDAFMIYKFLKVIFFFDNKKEYLRLIKKAKADYKNGYFGKLQEK